MPKYTFKDKHTFTYEIYDSNNPEFPNQKLTKEIGGDVDLKAMLEAFHAYLEGSGFIIDGDLAIVPEQVYYVANPSQPPDSDIWDNTPSNDLWNSPINNQDVKSDKPETKRSIKMIKKT